MVNVALDRDDLPHLLLSGAVLCGKGLFLLRQLPALFFERIHFGEPFAVKQFIHGGPSRPVVGQLLSLIHIYTTRKQSQMDRQIRNFFSNIFSCSPNLRG